MKEILEPIDYGKALEENADDPLAVYLIELNRNNWEFLGTLKDIGENNGS